jgi:hypothetical protein
LCEQDPQVSGQSAAKFAQIVTDDVADRAERCLGRRQAAAVST